MLSLETKGSGLSFFFLFKPPGTPSALSGFTKQMYLFPELWRSCPLRVTCFWEKLSNRAHVQGPPTVPASGQDLVIPAGVWTVCVGQFQEGTRCQEAPHPPSPPRAGVGSGRGTGDP